MTTDKTALIIGAGSDMALATAHAYARHGYHLTLAARNSDDLRDDLQDLQLRYRVAVTLQELDIMDPIACIALFQKPLPETVLCFVGLLGDQQHSQQVADAADLVMRSNYNAPALLLGEVGNAMERRGHGTIIAVSSVAGDRGRGSNYIYGSAKAGFTAFLSGLRNRLAQKGVHVMTVKPGFVHTKMTAGMNLPPLLTASPRQVAEAIYKAQQKKRNTIYVKPIWRLIMLVIAHIPEFIFKKLKL